MKISEKFVADIWQQQLITNLVTDTGKRLQVIYPGRVNTGSGCDFRDVVFAIDNIVATGDIEIHVKSSQWYSHGHHRDPKYNNVALHITMWHDSRTPIMCQNGKIIPTVCLSSLFGDSLDKIINRRADLSRHPLLSCPKITDTSNTLALNKLLVTAGTERLFIKIASFQIALEAEDAEQVLFRGLTRALGYAQNTTTCEELGTRLTISFIKNNETMTDTVRQAWILGTAGLLPSQRSKLQHNLTRDEEIDKLETTWQSIGTSDTMKEADWCFFRVRPDNFPTRRLIALSLILARYHKSGLLRGLLELVRKAPPEIEPRWLESGLIITTQGYWANHCDFGISKKKSSAILGRGRVDEIVINVILPFVYAWSEINAEPRLKRKAIEIYHHYPKLGDNELTRYMKQQLMLTSGTCSLACQQQGLIHVFKDYCRQRNCTECPVTFTQG